MTCYLDRKRNVTRKNFWCLVCTDFYYSNLQQFKQPKSKKVLRISHFWESYPAHSLNACIQTDYIPTELGPDGF